MSDLPNTPGHSQPPSSYGGIPSSNGGMSTSMRDGVTSRLGSEIGIPSTPGRRYNTPGYRSRVFSTPREPPQSTGAGQGENQREGDASIEHGEYLWGTNVSVAELEKQVRDFFEQFKENPDDEKPYYESLMQQLSHTERDVSFINMDCMHIQSYNDRLYKTLIDYIENTIQTFDVIATEKYEEWCGQNNQLQVRPYNLKKSDLKAMRELDPTDIQKLVSIKGMVIRVSPIIPDLRRVFFECSICKFTVEVEPNQNQIQEPRHCQNCSNNFSMEMIHNRSQFLDKQHVKLQEAPETIPDGQTPHTVVLVCLQEFKDAVQPGDRVTVTGMFQASSIRPNKNQRTIKSIFKTHIDVFHFQKTESTRMQRDDIPEDSAEFYNPLIDVHETAEEIEDTQRKLKELSECPDVYEKLTRSFAPGIWGHEDIKRGILCQLFGGVNKNFKKEGLGKCRGDINILLCGDPGTSKSQFLTHVNKIAPRGIYTSGKGSSSVGLTAYVSKDPVTKELVLESGALVLSDGGICCIDEFDKMSEGTRSVLHEAMEQQTISIAKAGVICTLNARTSVLAAANPVGSSWNPRAPIVENINLPPTLLSRFDLIYLVLDNPDPAHDRRLAEHITQMYTRDETQVDVTHVTPELFAKYISYARKECHPEISNTAAEKLVAAYLELRKFGGSRKTIAATPRQLESLIRISEALARMKFSPEVTGEDVDEALRLVKAALCQSVTDPTTGMVDMSIITTGVSESTRKRIHDSLDKVKEFLIGKGTNAPHRLRGLLIDYNKSDGNDLQMNQLREICRLLSEQGVISYDQRHDSLTVA